MTRLRLEPLAVRAGDRAQLAAAGCAWDGPILEHQVATVCALVGSDVVVNTAPTGTGKTLASLLGLASRPHTTSGIILAPTNALVAQHERDAREFITRARLPHFVMRFDAASISDLPTHGPRRGERLVRALNDPSALGAPPGAPLLVVTNPDIFFYATFALYGQHDRRNLQEIFFRAFDYVVIDELHLYDAPQLVSFLLFLVLSHELGFFKAKERKVVLLTATPLPQVEAILGRLAGQGVRIATVNAEAVPPGSPGAVPVLAPLELELLPAGESLLDSVDALLPEVARRFDLGEDGLIVGDRLADVNRLAARLAAGGRFPPHAVRRVTGPVPASRREEATRAPLVLATPTVDVGFNFAGRAKDRQPIDFVLADAPTHDRLWQRIGRAGRVLGRGVVDVPSWGVAFLPRTVVDAEAIRALEGVTLARVEAQRRLREAAGVKMRRSFAEGYLSWYALLQASVPLLELDRSTPTELLPYLERGFTTLREVVAPGTRWGYRGALGWARNRAALQRLQEARTFDARSLSPARARGWLDAHASEERSPSEADVERVRAALLDGRSRRATEDFRNYVEEELSIRQALLAFRGERATIEVRVDDPHALLSESAARTELDLVHLLRNFEFASLGRDRDGTPRVRLQALRDQPLSLRFRVKREETQRATFETLRLGRIVALRDLEVEALERGTEALVALPADLASFARPTAALLLETTVAETFVARQEHLYASRLQVSFPGSRERAAWEHEYAAYFGTDAFLFSARFPGACRQAASTEGGEDQGTEREETAPCP